MKNLKKIMVGCIISNLLLITTGCSTIYINNDKNKEKFKAVKQEPKIEIFHYHIFMTYEEYKREQFFKTFLNADHRKQRGRTAPNRALKQKEINEKHNIKHNKK